MQASCVSNNQVADISRVTLIRNSEWSILKNKTYDGVALRVGFGSMNRMILVLRFTDASSSSVEPTPFALRFLGRNGGGVRGRDMR